MTSKQQPTAKATDVSALASQPKAVTGDQGSYTNHGLAEQIALDRYLNSKDAGRAVARTIYAGRYYPPSARGE